MARATVMVLAAVFAVLLLASSSPSVAMAGRTDPADQATGDAVSPHHKKAAADVAAEGGCEGANDEDECMARRTLAAHTDYIYTQGHHN